MIIGVEGLSRSGKTTFINKFIERYPEVIRFRGAGAVNVGIQQHWQDYNFWMHNIIEQLDKLNDHKKIILWDRFLSDAIHSYDESYANEILRAMKSHKKKACIFIDIDDQVLVNRGTKEALPQTTRTKYLEKLNGFDHLVIRPNADPYYITDEHIDQAYEFIQSQFKNQNVITNDPY